MRVLLPFLLFAAPLAAQDLKALPPPIVKMMSPRAPKAESKSLPAPERAIINIEVRYYIDSPVKLTVITSPPGYIEAIEKKGPLTVVTKFSDDASVIAEKEFKGPFVYWLKPKKTGPCEILAIPEKVTTEKDIHRQMAEVDDGTKPIPPPKPVDPKVDPIDPAKPAPIAGDGYQVLVKFNNKINMPENVFTTIYGPKVTAWMNANVTKSPTGEPERRFWPSDIDTSKAPQKWQDAMKRPSQGDWWVIISNGVTGAEQPLPIGEDAFIELLNKYKR